MDKQVLMEKISQLEQATKTMDQPDKNFKLDDISKLRIAIDSMSISDIANKLRAVDLPSIQEMDGNIEMALKATSSHEKRVNAFNKAYGIIRGAVGFFD